MAGGKHLMGGRINAAFLKCCSCKKPLKAYLELIIAMEAINTSTNRCQLAAAISLLLKTARLHSSRLDGKIKCSLVEANPCAGKEHLAVQHATTLN